VADATRLRVVLFDIGGVVVDSPLHAIAAFEREHGLPEGFVNRVVADTGSEGAWGRLERGRLGMQEFFAAFESDCAAAGQPLSARAMMERIAVSSAPRPVMLQAIQRLRQRGLVTAALTNNWPSQDREDGSGGGTATLRSLFDAFFESSVLGLHKPDPRFYHHACDQLGVTPPEVVFLDDIGRNLKAARALGMTTIKVDAPEPALRELGSVLGLELLEEA
jgi:putative hydrolase of the HAD superfamily